ncbi:hypothetical protein Y032_0201g1725 [Ancylostoma ceylanicum]|uniref:Riboflavin transporter n=1 Tax=Ancylostoma ceylanicum TaxID=53326 RepID=A0A016SN90_9BILA|nr:hypothetical protein Y032_0201g1725 [Ancylostoma ceylanicum]
MRSEPARAGNYECEGAEPVFSPPRFQASAFFFVIFVWTVIATVAFEILCRTDEHNSGSKSRDVAHEDTPLNKVKSKPPEQMQVEEHFEELNAKAEVKVSPAPKPSISGVNYVVLLIATAIVNAQMNGVIPSVQSYAALPYSQATYHYGIALANVVSPAMSFLPFFITIRSLPILCTLTFCSSLVTAFVLYLASLSPNLIFDSLSMGSTLSICSSLVAAGLHSYLRVVFASLLREGEQSESRLFWCGVFIQIGSFMGSAVMFPLVNIAKIFTSAPPCR